MIEDRSGSDIRWNARQDFDLGARFACAALSDATPRQWNCQPCGHEGWSNARGVCAAREGIRATMPVNVLDIFIVHDAGGGVARMG